MPHVFRYDDAGAPTVNAATVGSFLAMFRACMVDGYNSKTVTITRSGATATAACTAHGFIAGQIVAISGAGEGEYNGNFTVLTAAANDFTFEVSGSPATPATGTITCKVAPAGWTEEYTGTNVAAFRSSPTGGTGCYVEISDTVNTVGVYPVTITAYSVMTAISTGSNATASVYAGRRPRNSGSDDLQWVLVADAHTFYVMGRGAVSTKYMLAGAGDIESLQGSDAYAYGTWGDFSSSTSFNSPPTGLQVNSNSTFFAFGGPPSTMTTSTGFVSLGRDYTGTGSESRHTLLGPTVYATGAPSTNSYLGGNNFPARPAANGAAEAAMPAYVCRGQVIRGKLRGAYVPLSDITGFAAGTIGTLVSAPDFGGVDSAVMAMLCGGSSPYGGLWIEAAAEW